jgi:hypothetical protein
VTISGQLSKDLVVPEPVLFFRDLNPPIPLRLDGVQFAIQEKMGINLWWIVSEAKPMGLMLILPLESRGAFDFEKISPIRPPDKALGVAMTAFKVSEPKMNFLVMLDFTK